MESISAAFVPTGDIVLLKFLYEYWALLCPNGSPWEPDDELSLPEYTSQSQLSVDLYSTIYFFEDPLTAYQVSSSFIMKATTLFLNTFKWLSHL